MYVCMYASFLKCLENPLNQDSNKIQTRFKQNKVFIKQGLSYSNTITYQYNNFLNHQVPLKTEHPRDHIRFI